MFCIPVQTYFLFGRYFSPFSRFTGFCLFLGAFYAPAVTITYCRETTKVFIALESMHTARKRCVAHITSFPQNPLSAESDLFQPPRNLPPRQAAETFSVRNRCVAYLTSFPQNPLSAESDLLLPPRYLPPKQAEETFVVRVSGDWQMHVV